MSVEPAEFISAMSRVPGPVTITTTVEPSGRRWGFTATSFNSLSVDPPLVLVCLDKSASTHRAFAGAPSFMINVLASSQSDVAVRFAESGTDRFAAGDMETCELGLPGLPQACVRIACAMEAVNEGGDHSILIGRVEAVSINENEPLLYWNRSYTCPAPREQLLSAP